jgi:hypothetical protein
MPRPAYKPLDDPAVVVTLERRPGERFPAYKIRVDAVAREVRSGVAGLCGVSVTVRWRNREWKRNEMVEKEQSLKVKTQESGSSALGPCDSSTS